MSRYEAPHTPSPFATTMKLGAEVDSLRSAPATERARREQVEKERDEAKALLARYHEVMNSSYYRDGFNGRCYPHQRDSRYWQLGRDYAAYLKQCK